MSIRPEEYQQRLDETRSRISEAGFDALLIHQPDNIHYLTGLYTTGFTSYSVLIVPLTNQPTLVLRDVELPAAQAMSHVRHVVTYSDSITYTEPLGKVAVAQRVIQAEGLSTARIGVEAHSHFLTLARFDQLKAALPQVTFEYEPLIVDTLRLRKSSSEIELIRQAAQAIEKALDAVLAVAAPGAAESSLAAEMLSTLARSGATHDGHVITSGKRTEQLHGLYSDRSLQVGDPVYLEMSGAVDHYIARMIRSAVVGTPTDQHSQGYAVLRDALTSGLKEMVPGRPASEVDRALRQPVLESGLRVEYGNRTGYSLSPRFRTGREAFWELVPEANFSLEPGMVFHVLVTGRGMGVSETVAVTDDGVDVLTSYDRDLIVI